MMFKKWTIKTVWGGEYERGNVLKNVSVLSIPDYGHHQNEEDWGSCSLRPQTK